MKLTGLTLIEAVRLAKEYDTFYRFHDGPWHDMEDTIVLTENMIISDQWEIRQPPKPEPKTEKRWRYKVINKIDYFVVAGRPPNFTKPFETSFYYKDENELKSDHPGAVWFKRIEESEDEFPIFE